MGAVAASPRAEGRPDGASLVVLLILAVAVWGFFELTEYVEAGKGPSEFDRGLLLAFRSSDNPTDPVGPRWFEEFVRDVTALGGIGPLTFLTLGVAGYLILSGRRRTSLLLVGWVGGGVALSMILKGVFARARPDVVPHLMHVSTASFPSGHAMMSTIVYVTLGSLLARVHGGALRVYVLALAVGIASLVGLSRVYLGVHWPSDVAAGFAVGAAWAGLAWLVARYLQRDGVVEPEPQESSTPVPVLNPTR